MRSTVPLAKVSSGAGVLLSSGVDSEGVLSLEFPALPESEELFPVLLLPELLEPLDVPPLQPVNSVAAATSDAINEAASLDFLIFFLL